MSLVLDPAVGTGGRRAAALSTVSVIHVAGAVVGTKRPVAVIVRSGDVTVACDLDTGVLSPDELEHRYPGAFALLAAAGWPLGE